MDFDVLEERLKIPRDCRRNGQEIIKGQTVYCGQPEKECMYRSESPLNELYRCMLLEKQGAWRYEK